MEGESEIEHFGFSAERVSLERKHFIRKILNNSFDAVLKKIHCSPETLELLSQQKEVVFNNIWESISKEINTADCYDVKNFSVPRHVLLPHCFDHVRKFSEADENKLDLQVHTKRQLFLENSVMLASLRMENDRYQHFAKFVEDEVNVQQQLNESFHSLNMTKVQKLVEKSRAYKI